MKSLYFLILILLWQEGLMYPSPLKFKVHKPEVGNKTGVEITWDAMENWDERDPITGYKLVVWEMKQYKTSIWVINSGQFEGIKENYYDPKPESLPDIADPTIITVSADNRKVVYDDFKEHYVYEFSVFPTTKNGEGPISDPYRLVT